MTTPPVPLLDAGNSLIAQVPAQLHTGMVSGPAGKIGVVTLRTTSTTVTVFLSAVDLRTWAELLTGLADKMSGGLTQATAADIAVLNQHHRG
jgi:hypothetical protein